MVFCRSVSLPVGGTARLRPLDTNFLLTADAAGGLQVRGPNSPSAATHTLNSRLLRGAPQAPQRKVFRKGGPKPKDASGRAPQASGAGGPQSA